MEKENKSKKDENKDIKENRSCNCRSMNYFDDSKPLDGD